MSRTKEQYFEQINEGKVYLEPSSEIYVPKYSVYFSYNGRDYTLLANTPQKIEELAKEMIVDFVKLDYDIFNTGEYLFDCGDWSIPVKLFKNENLIY
jgi:hypothetical protein